MPQHTLNTHHTNKLCIDTPDLGNLESKSGSLFTVLQDLYLETALVANYHDVV